LQFGKRIWKSIQKVSILELVTLQDLVKRGQVRSEINLGSRIQERKRKDRGRRGGRHLVEEGC
tara:strand:+ start:1363 stop:1551 length:189 start_codon:yes stop_codon:yes gene_type:complete